VPNEKLRFWQQLIAHEEASLPALFGGEQLRPWIVTSLPSSARPVLPGDSAAAWEAQRQQRCEADLQRMQARRSHSEQTMPSMTIAERKAFNEAGQRVADPAGGEPAKLTGRKRVPVPGTSPHPAVTLLFSPVVPRPARRTRAGACGRARASGPSSRPAPVPSPVKLRPRPARRDGSI